MAVINVPIGRDYLVSLGSSPRDYEVRLDGSTIYAGKGFARPGQTAPLVRLNDIAAPYLSQTADAVQYDTGQEGYLYTTPNIQRTFLVYDGNGSRIGNDYNFFYKWQDDNRNVYGRDGAHAWISPRARLDMPFVLTLYGPTPLTYDGRGADYVRLETSTLPSGMWYDIAAYQGPGNYTIFPAEWTYGDVTWIAVNGHRFEIVPWCTARYALYYVNAYGAWDFLLIEGSAIEGRSYDRHCLDKEYNNAIDTRSRWNYANEGTRTWELHTGWLPDGSAALIHHLLGSTLVVLYDFEEQTSIPVVVTDSSYQEQTYLTNDGKPVEYTIHVEEAREGLRR